MEDEFDVLDPTPNIHGLFLHYNNLYFNGSLGACTVEWSSTRMTLCAGQCHLIPSGGCRIRLSEPLLQYRPSRDLKDVLLHEMIHAAIFLSGQRDTDGDHGSLFQARMRAINASTVPDSQRPPGGYRIAVHHTMYAEVAVFRTHVWRCSSCGNTTRRSTNRRPQEADCRSYSKAKAAAAAEAGLPAGSYCRDERCWYHGHIRSCGGEFIKIAEPEKPQAGGAAGGGSSKRSRKQPAAAPAHTPPITAFFHQQQQQHQQQQPNEAQQLPGSSGGGLSPHPAAAGAAASPPAQQQQRRGTGAPAVAAASYWSGLGSGHRLGGRPTEALFPRQQQQQQQQQQQRPVQQQRPQAAAAGSEVVELLSSSDDDEGGMCQQPVAEGRGRPTASGSSKGRGHLGSSRSSAGPSPAAAVAGREGGDGGGGGSWMCPVCCEEFGRISNAQLNAHLDKCLGHG